MNTVTYHIWKWAENDLPGNPHEISTALTKGKSHPALQPFNPKPILRRLNWEAVRGRKRGEIWDWQADQESDGEVGSIRLTCPVIGEGSPVQERFLRLFYRFDLSGYDDAKARLMDYLLPKLNCFECGQAPDKPAYDIVENNLPSLLDRIDPQQPCPSAVLTNRWNHFVQCHAHGDRFCVEWRENHNLAGLTRFNHWRAEYPEPDRPTDSQQVPKKADACYPNCAGHSAHTTADAGCCSILRYNDVVSIFSAFLRGDSRPVRFNWRDIREELSRKPVDDAVVA